MDLRAVGPPHAFLVLATVAYTVGWPRGAPTWGFWNGGFAGGFELRPPNVTSGGSDDAPSYSSLRELANWAEPHRAGVDAIDGRVWSVSSNGRRFTHRPARSTHRS